MTPTVLLTAAAPPASAADYPTAALARALATRGPRGADLDAALALWVARARALDEPVERMLVALKRLLALHLRPRDPADPYGPDEVQEVAALLLRRAITAYYREPSPV